MPTSSHYYKTCKGCWRRCLYGAFQDFYPRTFAQAAEARWKSTEQSEVWQHKDRRRLLGEMHGAKQAAWQLHTSNCPYRGEHIGPVATRFSARFLHPFIERVRRARLVRGVRALSNVCVDAETETCIVRLELDLKGLRAHDTVRKHAGRYYPVHRLWWSTGAGLHKDYLEGGRARDAVAAPWAAALRKFWLEARTADPLSLGDEEVPF
jgi:hypothetical protein